MKLVSKELTEEFKKRAPHAPIAAQNIDHHDVETEDALHGSDLENQAELERQERFLVRAKDLVAELATDLGRTPTFHVTNFGCQMNARDAEKLSGVLLDAGFVEKEDESADFVIYNTCTVRDNADNHFYGKLGRASHYKKTNPRMKIAVCGCMMQEAANVEKLKESYPYVDLVFGTHNLFCFPEYLCGVYENEKEYIALAEKEGRTYNGSFSARHMLIDVWDSTGLVVEDLPVDRKYPYKSGINIMFGCNNFCSYCIVPYVRGRERSREPKEILQEIEKLVADGVVEIMLLGQNVNSYGNDLQGGVTFAQLLEDVANIPGLMRVRFMTPHPKDISTDVLEVIARHGNIARHVHFPLQSGSNRILKSMNRKYTREQYIERALKIREMIPDVAITTDIIAGFPGETAEDVDDTIDVINQVQFDNAYTFIYSIRHGTPAANMEQVPEDVAKAGFDRILAAVQSNARAQVKTLEGRTMTALIEEVNTQMEGYVTGRLSNNVIVHVKGDADMIGRFYDIRLDECKNFYFFGTVLGENERGY